MPGIVGILGGGAPDECRRLVGIMIGTMLHEPGYAAGTHFNQALGVYAGWIAHSESLAARQANPEPAGPLSLLFAGEWFEAASNEPKLLLESYEDQGESFAAQIDGLFSGLVIDSRRHRALLFNDRFGSERIYYHQTQSAVYFASEAKALLRVLPELRQFDEEGVAEFLTFGATLADRTMFRDVRVMAPGSIWTYTGPGSVTKRAYFLPSEWRELPELGAEEFRERLAESLREVVRSRVCAETQVGISITGGLDTRMIMACLPETRRSPVCYTFAGIDGETLDVRLGRRVAEACGLRHDTLRIGPDFLTSFGDLLDRTVYVTDGCVGALGTHEIYFNALAKQIAPVRVTGNFGSEILRGMSTFKHTNLSADLLEPGLRAKVAALRSSEPVEEPNAAAFAAFHEIPSIHFGIPAAARSQLTFRAPFLSNSIVALAVRSPPRERSSPAACSALIERYDSVLSAIPTDRGILPRRGKSFRPWSRLFAEVTFKLDYWHKEGLPSSLAKIEPMFQLLSGTGLLGLHKFLPYRGWFRQELAGYVRSVLTDHSTRRAPWWNGDALDRILSDHQSGRSNRLPEIHAVLTLQAVQRSMLSRSVATTHEFAGSIGN